MTFPSNLSIATTIDLICVILGANYKINSKCLRTLGLFDIWVKLPTKNPLSMHCHPDLNPVVFM
jgi:hypothetical protein